MALSKNNRTNRGLSLFLLFIIFTQVAAAQPSGGTRHEALVPDTLDLSARAELAIGGITENVDPEWDYFPYCRGDFGRRPPVLFHDVMGDIFGVQEKFLEALPLLRTMTGSSLNQEIERGMIQGVIKHTRGGILWADLETAKLGFNEWLKEAPGNTTVTIHDGKMAGVAALYYAYTGDPMWKKMAEEKIDAWYAKIRRKGDSMMYFPGGAIGHPEYVEGKGWRNDDFEPGGAPKEDLMTEPTATGVAYYGWFIMGMAQCYRVLGNEKAREMAEKLTNYTLSRTDLYDQYGRYKTRRELKPEQYRDNLYGAHFHIGFYGLLGPLEYAIATDNKPLMQYIRGMYEFSRSTGVPLLGWFPEYYDRNDRCVSASTADMITMAIKLSQAGIGEYWEDVDQYVRNQFYENQMLSADWVAKLDPVYLRGRQVDPKAAEISERAAERCVGDWASCAAPNDWMSLDRGLLKEAVPTVMLGDTANAARALYHVWEGMIERRGDTVQVNLLFNRASPWLDIDSYLPYEGKVVVKNKTAKNLVLRIPQWADKAQVVCQVGDRIVQPVWAANYLTLTGLRKSDVVTITFPMAMRTEHFTTDTGRFTVEMKGNDVVHIDPPGVACPLYQREYYRQNKAPMKKVRQYIPAKTIEW